MKVNGLFALSTVALFDNVWGFSIFPRQNPAFTDPNDDPFYAQPANVATFQAGAVIQSRSVVTTPGPNSVQLKYRTVDGQGNPISNVATLWIPDKPSKNTTIVSYSSAEDAVQLDCAPSWAWVKDSPSNNANIARVEGFAVVNASMGKGYYVINADAEGPSSSWLVGNQEGKAVLDSIRAAINFAKLDKNKTQVGLYGYSGGAHSVVWAANLRDSYANDVNIVGAAFGGTPVDLRSTYILLNGSSQAILAGAGLFGLAQGYPKLQADYQTGADGLTDEGKAKQKQYLTRNFCPNQEGFTFAGTNWDSQFKAPVLSNPTLADILNRESLLMNVSTIGVSVPKFPRLEYHGNKDNTVPYQPEAQYVSQQCNKGADIQFVTYDGQDHVPTALAGLQPALDFLDRAFNRTTPICKCGTSQCTPR